MLSYGVRIKRGEGNRSVIDVIGNLSYHLVNKQPDLHIAKNRGCSPVRLYGSLHLEITVSVIALDHVGDALAALHPGFDKLGKHLEDSPARARGLLLENEWGNAAEPKSRVVLLPISPLLKIHCLHT